MERMFDLAKAFNNGGVALDWSDTSKVTTMYEMFRSIDVFNQDISTWDTGEVTTMYEMFYSADAFNNGGVALDWSDTSKVTTMRGMFFDADAFNQDISAWNVSNVTNMDLMLWGPTLSTANYDALLIAWDALELQDNVSFDVPSSKYTASSVASTARASIISTDSWTISDGGTVTDSSAPTLSSSSPADGATSVAVDANIVLTFSEKIYVKTGNITLKKSSDDSTVETIAVTDSKITGTGTTTITIDPSTTLDQETGYYLNIAATAFDDTASNSYAGITDSTTLNFTTVTTNLPSPLDDKDVVGSIEAQVDVAKQIIQHSTIPALDRMEWLRRHKEENDLSHQGIKISFTNPMYSSISNALPVSASFNPTKDVLPNDWAMWTEGSVTIGKTSGTDTASLKDIESTGITIGADRKAGQDLVHGFALRFGRDDVDVGSSGTSLDTDSYSLSIYRTRSYSERTFLDSLLGISTLKTDLIRKSGANTLTGRRYGRQIFGSLSYSGVLEKDRLNLSPSVRLDGGYTNLSSYSETGTDALAYDAQNIKTGKVSAGVLLDDTIQFSSITFRPNGRLEYGADFSPSSNAVLSYVSDPSTDYTLSVSKRALHNFRAGIGLDIETVGGLSVTTSYEKNKALDSSYSDTARLGISYHHNANTQYALSFNGPDSSSAIFDIQTTRSGFNVNFKLEHSATDNIPHQAASLSLTKFF
jgi:surface protein